MFCVPRVLPDGPTEIMTPLGVSVCPGVPCGEGWQLDSSRWILAVTIVILFVSLYRRQAGGGGGEAAWFLCTARVLRAEFVA